MPAPLPTVPGTTLEVARALGQRIRAQRKQLRVSATLTAEAAGISRVTLHRIERGEPSVAVGAWVSVTRVLGLELRAVDPRDDRAVAPPRTVRLASYPQLERLAWQLRGVKELPAREALDLYERNWRHVDQRAMTERERELVRRLARAFGRERLLV